MKINYLIAFLCEHNANKTSAPMFAKLSQFILLF